MNILSYFQTALAANLDPTLLEFTRPITHTPLAICGIKPTAILEVRDNRLFKNAQQIGTALNIFAELTVPSSAGFFPAWLGFFSYEFAQYFGKSCHSGPRSFPDAFFSLYEQGLVIDNGHILHFDTLPPGATHPCQLIMTDETLTPVLTRKQFFSVVDNIQQKIRLGDVYQVNFSLPFKFTAKDAHMLPLYAAMRSNNKSPHMGIVKHDDWWLLSGSPERLFSLQNGQITTRPIAGTKKRAFDPKVDDAHIAELQACPKENAEHAMLVDLMRNDLNLIAKPNTVRVTEDRTVEFYSHVMHLVSQVEAQTSASLKEIFYALFPGGTITGAPKENVMATIADFEATPRGPYTGSLGYISAGFGVDFNILIRSIFKQKNQAVINAGAGIVIDSKPDNEWLEIHKKAESINDILQNRSQAKPPRKMLYGPKIDKPVLKTCPTATKVLFIENHDSFSFNLVDALQSLGAEVVVSLHKDIASLKAYSHVVIGPGPGNPNQGQFTNLLTEVIKHSIPLLGICLGHQAIGHHFGANIIKLRQPVHGKPHAISHFGGGLFIDLPSPTMFVRYHSLAIDQAPSGFVVDAYSDDDVVMAIRHSRLPIFGVQFHPESYLSQGGHQLLWRFLMERHNDQSHC